MNVVKDPSHVAKPPITTGNRFDLAMAEHPQVVPTHLSGRNSYSSNHTAFAQTCQALW